MVDTPDHAQSLTILNVINSRLARNTDGWIGHATGCADIAKNCAIKGVEVEFVGDFDTIAQDFEDCYIETGWTIDAVIWKPCATRIFRSAQTKG